MAQLPNVLKCDAPCMLYKRTHALLIEDKRPLPEIYKASGIPFYWLRKFRSGEIKSPNVNRVEFLHTFLTGAKLFN